MLMVRVGWVAVCGGLVASACSPGLASEGEGEGEGEGETLIDVGDPPFGFDTVQPAGSSGECSTEQWWVQGDRESELMHPGVDCIDCHISEREGPQFTIAGTVFQRLNDEDDCRGIPDATVDIIDKDGNLAFTLSANDVGNFGTTRSIANLVPYTAIVHYEGRSVEMLTPQTDGACNRCHTADGVDDAPGRILLP